VANDSPDRVTRFGANDEVLTSINPRFIGDLGLRALERATRILARSIIEPRSTDFEALSSTVPRPSSRRGREAIGLDSKTVPTSAEAALVATYLSTEPVPQLRLADDGTVILTACDGAALTNAETFRAFVGRYWRRLGYQRPSEAASQQARLPARLPGERLEDPIPEGPQWDERSTGEQLESVDEPLRRPTPGCVRQSDAARPRGTGRARPPRTRRRARAGGGLPVGRARVGNVRSTDSLPPDRAMIPALVKNEPQSPPAATTGADTR